MNTRTDSAPQTPPSSPAAADRPACLLCGARSIEIVDAFPSDLLQKAWSVFGVSFSKATWSMFDHLDAVNLYRCSSCGFSFCDPGLAGNGLFYAELERQKASYYPPDVPEFIRTLGWARERKLRTVLDIGCGEGAFLDSARAAGLQCTGIELNLLAAEVCRGKGHTIHTRSVSELLSDKAMPRFDLVTVFQVLEHVSDPVTFLKQAAQFLAPGGFLSVAVPNESGIYRICPREPHQWPPHHITRWRLQDLHRIGELCGLRVVDSGANRLLGREAEHFWLLRNQLAAALGERPLPGGKLLPKGLSFLYRKLGFRYFVKGMGTSVYALYQPQ